ncbi:hypothetical protein KY385_01915 [Candidatus Parcubacteria bacterium]|nr:hypothetical protein [Candidatus Parcubacteria bacterium]
MSLEKLEIGILKGGSGSFANENGIGSDQEKIDRTTGYNVELRESGLVTATAQVASGSVVEGKQYCVDRGIDPERLTFAELARRGTLGQMQRWSDSGDRYGVETTQILATNHELDDAYERHLFQRAIRDDLYRGALPIINENQATGEEELDEFLAAYLNSEEHGKKDFEPDNDWLAAHIAIVLGAKYLILQSQRTDGFKDDNDEVVEQIKVDDIDMLLKKFAGMKSVRGTGGIESKLKAMAKAVKSGKVGEVIYGNSGISPVDMILGKCACTRMVQ